MKTLEGNIKALNREILALKTSQPLSSTMRTFYSQHSLALDNDNLRYFEITYAEGTQPIMARAYCNTSVGIVLFDPVGNTQRFCNGRTYDGEVEILLLTTRQVLGVRRVS